MDKRTLKNLDKLTSSFSFGRVLSLISIRENTTLASKLGQEFKNGDERLINSEIGYLAALWVNNYKKSTQNWNQSEDLGKFNEAYRLMRIYHNSLKSNKYGEKHQEVSMYEGDGGYDWQFLDIAKYKYSTVQEHLKLKENFDIDYIHSTYYKLMEEFNQRLKDKSQEDLSCNAKLAFDIMSIPLERITSLLCKEEFCIFNKFVVILGTSIFSTGNKIISNLYGSDFKPIILLPNNHIIIPSFYMLAKYINEAPYYWITNDKRMLSEIGKSSEIATYEILKDSFHNESIFHSILIKKKNVSYTDIDSLLVYDNHALIYQQKGKKLTLESMQGDENKIDDDFNKAVIKAYEQGIKCVDAIKNRKSYVFSENVDFTCCSKFHIICLTTDYYPTITSMSYEENKAKGNKSFPLVAMTLYDLYTILVLLDIESYVEYVEFREQCAKLHIYGDNEMFYLGKYLAHKLNSDEPMLYKGEKLPNEYAILVDYIVHNCRDMGFVKPYTHQFLEYLKKDNRIYQSIFNIFLSAAYQTRKIVSASHSTSDVDISPYLQFLQDNNWSEIIDSRWKYEVKHTLVTNFPHMTDEEWREIEEIIFV